MHETIVLASGMRLTVSVTEGVTEVALANATQRLGTVSHVKPFELIRIANLLLQAYGKNNGE